jgi:hypothetical protein
MHVIFGPWTSNDVAVVEIGQEHWRVSDLTRREADAMAVLGFVERTDLGFEAISGDPQGSRRVFRLLESAVDSLSQSEARASGVTIPLRDWA